MRSRQDVELTERITEVYEDLGRHGVPPVRAELRTQVGGSPASASRG